MADLCLSAIGGSRPLTDSRVAPKQPFKQLTIQGATSKIELSAAYLDGAKFGAEVSADHERFGKIIRDAGIVPN